MLFTFEKVRKLARKHSDMHLAVFPLGLIKSWGIPVIHSDTTSNDVILVNYDTAISLLNNELQVTNPRFIYKLPSGSDSDEYVVLFFAENHYFPSYCLQQLMTFDPFERLIEKSDKISSNSTRLMTFKSLQDIFKDFQKYRIEYALWPQLSKGLIDYVDYLIKHYPELGYLPVAERKKFRKNSIADSALAWYCYIRYFIEQWNLDFSLMNMPGLSRTFHQKNWSGHFFDRSNPVLYVNKGNFNYNDAHRDLIYEIWQQWIKEA